MNDGRLAATKGMATQGSSRVPAGRLERLLRLGTMAGGVAAGAAAEQARRWWSGEPGSWSGAVVDTLDPAKLTETLGRMRGAAMKLGQLLSMEARELLPPPLAEALGALRNAGATMSRAQLHRVLRDEYGADWRARFREFDEQPVAAASIGQVHRAIATDGRVVALKIQFPGVARSIDSDVDNLGTLLRLASLLPAGVDVEPLLAEVKRHLHQETDYVAEGRHLARFRELMGDMPGVVIPRAHADLTTGRVLAMDFMDADPIDVLWRDGHPAERRNRIGRLVQGIVFRELFELGLMQSDPNFANYLVTRDDHRLVLLDFGATIEVSERLRDRYRTLVSAAVEHDLDRIADLLVEYGWAPGTLTRDQLLGLASFVHLSVEPLRAEGPYDYGASDLSARARERSFELAFQQGVRHPPPPEMVFVQRKLSGTYLLCAHLGAVIDSGDMFRRFLAGEPIAALTAA